MEEEEEVEEAVGRRGGRVREVPVGIRGRVAAVSRYAVCLLCVYSSFLYDLC